MLTASRTALLNLLLTALLLSAQLAYALHDAESVTGDHTHSSECLVCLSQHNSVGDIPLQLIIPVTTPVEKVSAELRIHWHSVRFQYFSIRAPPIAL